MKKQRNNGRGNKALRDFLKPEMEGKPFTPKFIGYLKWGGKVVLRNAVIFTVIGQVLIRLFDPLVLDQGLPIIVLVSIIAGGISGIFFLSPSKLIKSLGIAMHTVLLYSIFLPKSDFRIIGLLVAALMYVGMGVAIYVLIQYAKLLFEELEKSGHWKKKNKNTIV